MAQKIVLYTDDRLYDHPARILLTHKQREYETKSISAPGVPESYAKFKRHTPAPLFFERGEVPFVSAGLISTENYIDDRFAGFHVLPSEVQARYRMLMATQEFINNYPLINQLRWSKDELCDDLSKLTKHMDEHGSIFSRELNFFDVFLLPILWRVRKIHPGVNDATHPFNAYARNYFTHPSFVSSLIPEDDEQDDDPFTIKASA